MPLRVAFVAAFVVAGESRHQFLPVLVGNVLDELIGARATHRFRVFVGLMQLLGAVGVIVGLFFAPVGVVAALGLVVMMFLGLAARYRIRDAPRLMLPAANLAILNAILVALFTTR